MSGPAWRPADFAHPLGERLLCTLCPHACTLADGQTGRCAVRRNRGGRLETATFATAVRHRHAIERKPLYHYRPGATVLTLAAPGCTFACGYCQNFRISQHGRHPQAPWQADAIDPDAIADAMRDDTDAIDAIAFSYAEPTLAAELTLALAARGLDIVWQTNGFVTPAAALRLAPALAAVNVDLKAADEDTHRRLTGAPLAPVLEALALWRAGPWIEISTPLIPGVNDDAASIERLIDAVLAVGPETPWHLLRFHPDFRLRDRPPTPPELLARVRDRARARGLRHVYVERALGPDARTTWCPGCGAAVITRHIWALDALQLVDGACPRCHAAMPGRWDMP